MKIFCLVVLTTLFAFNTYAQPEKGALLLNGRISHWRDGGLSETTSGLGGGVFVGRKISVGLDHFYSRKYEPGGFFGSSTRSENRTGIVVRNYFRVGEESRFFFFLNSMVQVANVWYDDGDKTKFIVYGTSPSFAFFPAKRVSIDFVICDLVFASKLKDDDDPYASIESPFYPRINFSFLISKK